MVRLRRDGPDQRQELDEEGRVRFRWNGRDVALELRGRHNARNALVALGIAQAWGVQAEDAIAGIEAAGRPQPGHPEVGITAG